MTATHEPLAELWATVVGDLHTGALPLTRQQNAWLSLVQPLTLTDEDLHIAVPNAIVQVHVERDLRGLIIDAAARQLGRHVDLTVHVQPSLGAVSPSNAPVGDRPIPDPTPTWRGNPRYTFDTFVVGAANRLAHAAAVGVAESPALAYNPFFIWGESGLGKTHLLHAIGHYASRLFPNLRITYVSTEEFTNDFINSLRDDRREQFKRRYRDETDLLLVDDIQFLLGRERTQEEFFHTFNALHEADKQIVVASDRPPNALPALAGRLRTRFQAGLITDVSPPDLETRVAILRKKASGMDVPDEVLALIASRIERNIRELEGALIRVNAYASLTEARVDRQLADVVLDDLVGAEESVSPSRILAITGEHFGVSVDQLLARSKEADIVLPRHIAMYLCRQTTGLSLPKIGQLFNRHHSTVLNAVNSVEQRMRTRRDVYDHVHALTARVRRDVC